VDEVTRPLVPGTGDRPPALERGRGEERTARMPVDLIENLTYPAALEWSRPFVRARPLPVSGLDAFPLHVIARE